MPGEPFLRHLPITRWHSKECSCHQNNTADQLEWRSQQNFLSANCLSLSLSQTASHYQPPPLLNWVAILGNVRYHVPCDIVSRLWTQGGWCRLYKNILERRATTCIQFRPIETYHLSPRRADIQFRQQRLIAKTCTCILYTVHVHVHVHAW